MTMASIFIAGFALGIFFMNAGDMLSVLWDRLLVLEGFAAQVGLTLVSDVMPIISVLLLVKLLRQTKRH